MLENVLGAYIDRIERERDYDAPFLALLGATDYQDVHLTHGPIEKGKDFIAKSPDGAVQWVFQTKRGNVGVAALNGGILGQLQAAAMSGLSHPAFDADLPRQIVLVATGTVTQPASDLIDAFSNDALSRLGHPRMQVWNRDRLVEEFMRHGLGGIRAEQVVATDVEAQGRFYLLYGAAIRGALDLEDADDHSVGWLGSDMPERRSTLVGAVEAAILADACKLGNQFYEAAIVQTTALRMAMSRLHEEAVSRRRDELRELCEAQLLTVLKTGRAYCESVLSLWEVSEHRLDRAVRSHAAIVTYPVHCMRLCETLALQVLSSDEESARWAGGNLEAFVAAEPGVAHPISDRYAVSLTWTVLALLKVGNRTLARQTLVNSAVWVCDRAQKGLGLAHMDATVQDEVDQLLGYAFPGLKLDKQNTSFLATALTDLAAFMGDERLYEDLVNDLRAVELFPENFQSRDTLGQFLIDHPDVIHTSGIELAERLDLEGAWPSHTPCAPDEPSTYATVAELGPSAHLALALLLRDRLFLGLWPMVVPTDSAA